MAERLPLTDARHAHELLDRSAATRKLVLVPQRPGQNPCPPPRGRCGSCVTWSAAAERCAVPAPVRAAGALGRFQAAGGPQQG
ncbi:hypothetical protein ACWGQL_03000 [Streptomyces lydicus]